MIVYEGVVRIGMSQLAQQFLKSAWSNSVKRRGFKEGNCTQKILRARKRHPKSKLYSSLYSPTSGKGAGRNALGLNSFWNPNAFETDSDLPAGWMRVQDTSGTYYWHIPTGTTQWEPPGRASPSQGSSPQEESQLTWTGFAHQEGFEEGEFWKDEPNEEAPMELGLKDPEEGTLSFPAQSLSPEPLPQEEEKLPQRNANPGIKCFAVRSLGWVEMTEEELAPGRSSVAVNNCIRQLSYHKNNLHDPMSGGWGEGKDLLLQLEDETLKLVEPQSQALLHAQPIVSIRVWGVGRDSGRDFAYVARDKLTQMLKCHVFRCEAPAKNIATSLHEICSKIMSERRSARCLVNGLSLDHSKLVDVPFQVEFPVPKNELVQKFQVYYLGNVPVAKPVDLPCLRYLALPHCIPQQPCCAGRILKSSSSVWDGVEDLAFHSREKADALRGESGSWT
ncbi:Amyloid beta A4 precursor protein-binding family B member 1 [Microtus ochrogaster]|uniref:Amyloid beta A4 protein-binding family B member 1 n=1 Tax=Microtus ochrogaster TaxID=79684 RepID=A0A8J6GLM1_MICOH|nr:Amyloid beta A4 precursor protein-binding family B member 1 [Microtus ochrogaster]